MTDSPSSAGVRRPRRPPSPPEALLTTRPLALAWSLVYGAGMVVLVVLDRDWRVAVVGVAGLVITADLWHRRIVLVGRVVFHRAMFRWFRPLHLDQLTEVRTYRGVTFRDLFPERRLSITDATGAQLDLAPMMWTNWPSLARVLAAQVVARDGPTGLSASPVVQVRAARYLARYLPEPPAP